MKPATRVELLARADRLPVDLLDRRQQQRPALGEELVQHLVLGVEVVVDEAVGDARPRRRCRRRGRRGSPGARRRGSRRRGSGGACRPAAPSRHRLAIRRSAPRSRPAIGVGAAVGERGKRRAHALLARRGRGRRRRSTPVGGLRPAPRPRGRRSSSARRSRSAAAPRRSGSAAIDEGLVLDRAGAQQDLPVVAPGRAREGRRDGDQRSRRARRGSGRARESGGRSRRSSRASTLEAPPSVAVTISSPGCSCSDSR